MGAREKLNAVAFGIAAFVAGVIGVAAKSITVFFISIVVLGGVLLHDGTIRPNRQR